MNLYPCCVVADFDFEEVNSPNTTASDTKWYTGDATNWLPVIEIDKQYGHKVLKITPAGSTTTNCVVRRGDGNTDLDDTLIKNVFGDTVDDFDTYDTVGIYAISSEPAADSGLKINAYHAPSTKYQSSEISFADTESNWMWQEAGITIGGNDITGIGIERSTTGGASYWYRIMNLIFFKKTTSDYSYTMNDPLENLNPSSITQNGYKYRVTGVLVGDDYREQAFQLEQFNTDRLAVKNIFGHKTPKYQTTVSDNRIKTFLMYEEQHYQTYSGQSHDDIIAVPVIITNLKIDYFSKRPGIPFSFDAYKFGRV